MPQLAFPSLCEKPYLSFEWLNGNLTTRQSPNYHSTNFFLNTQMAIWQNAKNEQKLIDPGFPLRVPTFQGRTNQWQI